MTGNGTAMTGWPTGDIGIPPYRAIAAKYHRLHNRFLRFAGAGGQSAFEGSVLSLVNPGMKILDAACGTGAFASRLIKMTGNRISLTLLDACPEMLSQAEHLPAKKILGRLEHLPFADGSFDLVSCAWGIETTEHPAATIRELTRVVRPGGYVCLVTCANAGSPRLAAWIVKRAIRLRRTGQFVDPAVIKDMASDPGIAFARPIPCKGPALAMVMRKAQRRNPQAGAMNG
jgi:ubiquinone/menaquinone biosynthesis C-methylase UbiE